MHLGNDRCARCGGGSAPCPVCNPIEETEPIPYIYTDTKPMNATEEPPVIETAFEIVPAELGLELAAKNSLELAFSGFFTEAAKWKEHAATITEPKLARTARLELKNLRVAAEKKRKELKEDSLRMGKAIDGANNILLALIVPIEKDLEDVEKAAERAEAARIKALTADRAEALAKYEFEAIGIQLGTLTNDQWSTYLQDAKDVFEARKERERKAVEEAAAAAKKEAEEREAQRLENIHLKAEAEKAAAALEAERKAQAEKDAAAKAEREKIEAAAAEDRRKAQESAAAEAKRREAAEREAQALRDAEVKRVADARAADAERAKAEALAAKKAAAAPDKAKLMEFAAIVRKLEVPIMKSIDGKNVAVDVGVKVDSFAKWIETQAATL